MKPPPSLALTTMAKNLAHLRYYGKLCLDWDLQVRNWFVDEHGLTVGASGEHYRIIDRITQGEKP